MVQAGRGRFYVHKHNEMPHEAVMRHGKAIDFTHLDQYTLGDEGLQGELLRLFSMQLEAQMNELHGCTDAGAWKQAAHTLKGAARAVGVWQVAEVAERLETAGFDGGPGDARDLADLREAAAEFQAEFARLAE
jgi:HPt (histidine-containing phosphotransfer) domain-containing protein